MILKYTFFSAALLLLLGILSGCNKSGSVSTDLSGCYASGGIKITLKHGGVYSSDKLLSKYTLIDKGDGQNFIKFDPMLEVSRTVSRALDVHPLREPGYTILFEAQGGSGIVLTGEGIEKYDFYPVAC